MDLIIPVELAGDHQVIYVDGKCYRRIGLVGQTINFRGPIDAYAENCNGRPCVPCPYTLDPNVVSYSANGGEGTVFLTTDDDCRWRYLSFPSNNPYWLTTGLGSGSMFAEYIVPPAQDWITVTHAVFIGTEPDPFASPTLKFNVIRTGCTGFLSPATVLHDFELTSGTLTGQTDTNVCRYTISADSSWIRPENRAPLAWIGNNTVFYVLDPNTKTASRTGNIVMFNSARTSRSRIVQSGCIQEVFPDPTGLFVSSDIGSYSFSYIAQYACEYTPTLQVGALIPTMSVEPPNPTGNAIVTLNVPANPTVSQRDAAVNVYNMANALLIIRQSGCQYSINPTSVTRDGAADNGLNIAISHILNTCNYSATRTGNWITLFTQSPSSLPYSLTEHTAPSGAVRTGYIAFNNGEQVTILQSGCVFAPEKAIMNFNGFAVSNTGVKVQFPNRICNNWGATTSDNWLILFAKDNDLQPFSIPQWFAPSGTSRTGYINFNNSTQTQIIQSGWWETALKFKFQIIGGGTLYRGFVSHTGHIGEYEQLTGFTIECWAKTTGTNVSNIYCGTYITRGIGSNIYGYGLGTDGSSRCIFNVARPGDAFAGFEQYYTTGTGNPKINDNQFHHLAITFISGSGEPNQVKFFVDGVMLNPISTSPEGITGMRMDTGQNRFIIGHHANAVIDEVRLSNVIRYIENFTPLKTFEVDAETLLYWKLNEGSGNIVMDVANGKTGYLVSTEGQPPAPLPEWVVGIY